MIKLGFYRALSFVLLPVAVLFGLFSVMLLMVALANPPMLLPVFVVSCVSIYVFTSFSFLNKGIIRGSQCKASLKDWIKVNAIVSILFSLLLVLNVVAMMARPELLSQALDQSLAMQAEAGQIPKADLLKAARWMMYFLGIVALLLLLHIFFTFRLLKQYSQRFGEVPGQQE